MLKSLSKMLTFLLVLFALTLSAQTSTVSGLIQNQNGESVEGVVIRVPGRSYSATSAADGKFQLTEVAAGTYKIGRAHV